MKLTTPAEEQGQIVEYSYGWLDGVLYRRTLDQSEPPGSPERIAWHRADEDEAADVEERAGLNCSPCVSEWTRCEDPQSFCRD